MKVTLNWLKEHVDFDWSPAELAERLTMLGLEVEGVEARPGEFEGVVVGHVLSRDPHPNADRLSVCRVHDGKGERQIVCGAQNFRVGDKVPLILPGATLPPKAGEAQPFTIKVGKIRGVESHGMLCSADELGVDAEATGHRREDGLLILRGDAVVGQGLAAYLGRPGADVVYDLEVTPNRPDLNSVVGIAREISAVTGHPLKEIALGYPQATGVADVATLVSVRIDAPEACHRYTARIIRGVRVGPSPGWLQARLAMVGLRSINNVVDVTNLVMLETGQPLHAFDLRLLGKGGADGLRTVVVRRALAGEPFTTLDGVQRTLGSDALLIADSERGIALAGVMGGLDSGIQPDTTDVLVESAWFDPVTIRRTSKGLGLRTDASYRFERGVDVGGVDAASRRAVRWILELAGGEAAAGVVDAWPVEVPRREVDLRPLRVRQVLGIEVPEDQAWRHLRALGLSGPTDGPGGSSRWGIPTWRADLKQEIDLVEEVARLHGVDRIPSTTPRGAKGSHSFDATYDVLMELRRLLAGLGLSEVQGQTLVSGDAARLAASGVVALANPLSGDMDVLRPSLFPGLMDVLRHNMARRNADVRLFELGRVFGVGERGVVEGWRLAIALTGARLPAFWSGADRDAKCDLADLKGMVEEVLEWFGLRGVAFVRRPEPTGLWVESATLALGGKLELGQVGQVLPAVARRGDLRDPVLLAELNLDVLLARRNAARSAKALPGFPSSQRDVAMVVDEAVTHDAVLAAVRGAKPANLESVELFDVFRGRHVPEGRKSVAYSFTYRAADRTLKDEEVTAAHQRVVEAFRQSLKATIRE